MAEFDNILKEARLLDRGESVAATDDITYFRRLLENTNKRVNSIRPFHYANEPLLVQNAAPSATQFYSFSMKDDTTTPAVISTGTAVVDTSVAYFGHLNLYYAPPSAALTAGTWTVTTELNIPRNNDPAGGTNRVPITGFDSTINVYTPQTYNSFLFPSLNNWGAIDKFNTGDLDRICFHNFRVRIATGAASNFACYFYVIFKGYQADLS
jgi:hypothetical protein